MRQIKFGKRGEGIADADPANFVEVQIGEVAFESGTALEIARRWRPNRASCGGARGLPRCGRLSHPRSGKRVRSGGDKSWMRIDGRGGAKFDEIRFEKNLLARDWDLVFDQDAADQAFQIRANTSRANDRNAVLVVALSGAAATQRQHQSIRRRNSADSCAM